MSQHEAQLDDEWPAHTRRSGIRMRIPTAILLALLIGAAGLWGGATLEKHRGTTAASGNSAASAFAAFRNRAAGAGRGTGGFGGGTGGFGAAGGGAVTFGTLTAVQGKIVYLTSASGSLVKVKLSPKTTISRNAKSTKGALKLGDTVIVSGKTAANGTVTATTLTATAKGVIGGLGRFGGGGGFGGASGGSGSTAGG